MSGDKFSSEGRAVLGDMTNLPQKRSFSLILDDALPKSRDAKGKSKVLGSEDVSYGIENRRGEMFTGQDGGVEKITSFSMGGRDRDVSSNSPIHSISDLNNDSKAPQSSDRAYSHEGLGTRMPGNLVQVDEVAPMETDGVVPGGSISHVPRDAGKDLDPGKLASNKSGSIEWSRLPVNSPTESSEPERCKLAEDPDSSDTCHGNDPPGSCSCSFCLTAGYILSDLHYQDIKGRITALRKSQKETNALIQKLGKGKDIEDRRTSNSSGLESSLLNQWRSLFLHMGGALAQEGNQLQAKYIALKELRENCKMDLEANNKMPSNKDKQD